VSTPPPLWVQGSKTQYHSGVILARGLLCLSRTSVNCRIDQLITNRGNWYSTEDRSITHTNQHTSLLRTSIIQTLIQNRSAICRDRGTRVKRPTTRVARALGTTPQGIVRAVGGRRRTAALPSAKLLQPHLHVLDKTRRNINKNQKKVLFDKRLSRGWPLGQCESGEWSPFRPRRGGGTPFAERRPARAKARERSDAPPPKKKTQIFL
jgi:hypothetical protein